MIDYLPKVAGLITIESMTLSRTLLSVDGNSAVLEFSCKGSVNATGLRYDQRYISVIDLKDQLIIRYRDYWNPLILLTALGQTRK